MKPIWPLAAALVCLSIAGPAAAQPGVGDVVETKRGSTVYFSPTKSSSLDRGVVMSKARFEVLELKAGRGCRGAWLRIADRAWLCSDVTRATDQPAGGTISPKLAAGKLLPHTYVTTKDVTAYPTLDDATAGTNGKLLAGQGGYKYRGTRKSGGARYVKTDVGWLAAADAPLVKPTNFHGVDLAAGDDQKRLAFVGPRRANLYDAAGQRLAKHVAKQHYLGEIGAPITAGKATLYPIGEGRHLRQRDVRLIRFSKPPAQVGADEHWIDVDMSNQTLVAYVGSRPLLATLVSTANTTTPVGEFRIERKRPYSRMMSKPYFRRKWDVHAPWVISVKGAIAIHTVYWHEDFGRARSMGCINLSPRDAKWIWDFTYPALPPGWSRIQSGGGKDATLVRIRR